MVEIMRGEKNRKWDKDKDEEKEEERDSFLISGGQKHVKTDKTITKDHQGMTQRSEVYVICVLSISVCIL